MGIVLENWTIYELTGYKPITTFYTDFSIADKFGVTAIKDTYNLAFEGWKSNVKYITELVMPRAGSVMVPSRSKNRYCQAIYRSSRK